MFRLRSAQMSDIDDLHELSELVFFINLPQDKDTLAKRIALSMRSFARPSEDLAKNLYLFVLEDLAKKKVVGTSAICGRHGTAEIPHFFLKVSREHKYSSTLNTGFIHGTLKFGVETSGWSEIGALVLHPDYRGGKSKAGRQISFVRFLYMALNRRHFTDHIHTELMPPLDKDGNSPLWEVVGRKFLGMGYREADALSRQNKEFILSLYPQDTIYKTLLPPEARDVIGQVGQETKPVVKMLESIGFFYTEEVDPFDGGPHYRAPTDEIAPIKNLFRGTCRIRKEQTPEKKPHPMLIQLNSDQKTFQAACAPATIDENTIFLAAEDLADLDLKEEQEVCAIHL